MFTASFDPRLRVIVSSCGFSSLQKDDVPSWTGPRYMPRIARQFANDAARVPFDFDVSGVREVIEAASPVYRLFDKPEYLQAIYPDSPHDFPPAARQQAYDFLDKHLRR